MEYLSEVLKILDGALKANGSMACNYAGLLADKLEESGQSKQAKLIRSHLSRANPAIAHAQDSTRGYSLTKSPVDSESQLDTLEISNPGIGENTVLLPDAIQARVLDFIDNVEHFDRLQKVGAALPSRLIIEGPPGTGKTCLARWVASTLKLPLYTVRCDTLISSLLGQTSKNLRKVFDFSQQTPCILFLDEFDALAGARGNDRDIGELQRVVISLLQNIDSLPNSAILIAATNHSQLLDPAIWRRFSFLLSLPMPDKKLRDRLWRQFIGNFEPDGLVWDRLIDLSEGATGALIEQTSMDAKRKAVLEGTVVIDENYLLKRLGLYLALLKGIKLSSFEQEIRWLREWSPKPFSMRALAKLYNVSTRYISNTLREKQLDGAGEKE